MKEHFLKRGVTLILALVLIVAGVLVSHPGKSQAAAKTTYNVVIQKSSPLVTLISINDGAVSPQLSDNEATSFQIQVEAKVITEKVKSTGKKASYHPVTIIAKSYKAPTSQFKFPTMLGGGTATKSTRMSGDAKGKLYISGGDVDVSNVLSEKKLTTKIGDGKEDPKGALIIPFKTVSDVVLDSTGKKFMTTTMSFYLTTGKSYTIVNNSKSGLEGKAIPDNDTSKSLPTPLVGMPFDLEAGTGTLVDSSGIMNNKNKTLGITLDYLFGELWVLKITK